MDLQKRNNMQASSWKEWKYVLNVQSLDNWVKRQNWAVTESW